MLAQEYTDVYLSGDWWQNPILILLIVIVALAGITFFFCHSSSVASSSRERAKTLPPERKSPISSEPKEKQRRASLFELPPLPAPVPETGGKELRTSLRRKGKSVKVFVEGLPGTTEPVVCWVLDRSKGGLSVLMAQPINVGILLRIRAAHAPDTEPWVSVEVKNCRKRGYRWTVGCRFDADLPWSTLLLFG